MSEVEDAVLAIYVEADSLYSSVAPSLPKEAALGYEVMYGPLTVEPPLLMVGYQPGGEKWGPPPKVDGASPPWPTSYELATANYALAVAMRRMFDKDFLLRCTGLNVVFMRSPGMTAYSEKVPLDVRRRFSELGIRATKRVVELLRPRGVLFLAIEAMKLFDIEAEPLFEAGGTTLTAGSLSGTPAFGVPHPTGSRPRPSGQSMRQIGDFILEHLKDEGET